MKFSRTVSKQPRKKRKERYQAPLHKARVFLHSNLSKDLRKKLGARSVLVRRGDTVKVMRGTFKGKTGKVSEVDYKSLKVFVEGMTVQGRKSKKRAFVPFDSSNLQITEKYSGKDEKQAAKAAAAPAKKEEKKAEEKPVAKATAPTA
ncbi:MAG: 50S ribosomal protein L24 [Candidatus Micrarchaeia archaeon]|jgi:large subunit ribosomal protein L24